MSQVIRIYSYLIKSSDGCYANGFKIKFEGKKPQTTVTVLLPGRRLIEAASHSCCC